MSGLPIRVQEAVRHFLGKPIILPHRVAVMCMYRRALRTAFSWSKNRIEFLEYADEIRGRFDKNRHLEIGSFELREVLEAAERELIDFEHPEPYIAAYMPGGSGFMRDNAFDLQYVYPDGIPHELGHQKEIHIDGSTVRPGCTPLFMVDFPTKSYVRMSGEPLDEDSPTPGQLISTVTDEDFDPLEPRYPNLPF